MYECYKSTNCWSRSSNFCLRAYDLGDVIIIELNLLERKVKLSFKDKEYESKLSKQVPDQDMRYYLVCRMGLRGLGHQMSIVDFSSIELYN